MIETKSLKELSRMLLVDNLTWEFVEVWKPIVGYEGLYSVSNFGRVRSERNSTNSKIGMIVKPDINKNGYYRTKLYSIDGKRHRFLTHRLVAIHFVGPCPEGQEANHKDMNPSNNVFWNLEYVTHSQNVLHAYKMGRVCVRGEENGQSKLTDEQVNNIRSDYSSGMYSQRYLARKYNVVQQSICRITQNRAWKHLLNVSA